MSQTKAQLIAGTSSQDVTFNDATVNSLNGGPLSGTRNRIINGDMRIDQRNGGAAVSSGISTATYTADRWSVATDGAAVTAQRQGTTTEYWLNVTGAAGVTACNIRQRIEAENIGDLAGKTVTVSFACSSTTLTTIGVVASYANTGDNFAAVTIISSQNVSITSTKTTYSVSFSLPAQAANGVELMFSLGAFTSGSFAITDVQLEPGTVATPFERRSYGQELALCSRYCQVLNHAGIFNGSSGTAFVATKWSTTDFIVINVPLVCQMRVAPSITQSSATNRYISNFGGFLNSLSAATCSSKGPITLAFTNNTIAASFGWVDDIGIITASSEL